MRRTPLGCRSLCIALLYTVLGVACAGAHPSEPLTAASRLSRSPAVAQARRLVPEEVQRARRALDAALRAADDGRQAEADRLAIEAAVRFEIAVASSQAKSARLRIEQAERQARDSERARDQNNAARRAEENRISVLLKQQEIDRVLEEERRLAVVDERGRPQTSTEEARERQSERRRAAAELVSRAKVLLIAAEALLGTAAESDAVAGQARDSIAQAEHAAAGDAVAAYAAAVTARAKAQEALAAARRAASGRAAQAELRAEDAALLTEAGAAGGLSPREDARGVVVTIRGLFDRRAEIANRGALEPVARLARAHTSYPIVIEGHTSEARGAQAASLERAEAVVQALVAMGVDAGRLRAVGQGASRPLAPETLSAARERNERIEIIFVRAGN